MARVVKRDKGVVERIIFSPDEHYPYHDKSAVNCLHKAIETIKPSGYVCLGDIVEGESVSHWQWKRKKKPPLDFQLELINEEIKQGNRHLDKRDEVLGRAGVKKKDFIEGNHDCLDIDTELLTNRGWVYYKDISTSDKVLSINPETNKGCWSKINKIIIKEPHKPFLCYYTDRTISLMCTENHRIFSRTPKDTKYSYKYMKNIKDKISRQIVPVSTIMDEKDYPISDDFLRLFGWFITDAHLSQKRIIFYQRKSNVHKITNLLDNLNITYKYRERDRNITEICGKILKKKPEIGCEITLSVSEASVILSFIPNRKIPQWFYDLSKRQFDILLEVLIDADGTKASNSDKSFALYKSKPFLDEIQILCIINGYGATISQYRKNYYRLNICKRREHHLELGGKTEKIPYNDMVWCLEVPYGNFLIRREDKVHFTGNSWYNHLVEENPHLEKTAHDYGRGYLFRDAFGLKRRGYKYYPLGERVKYGKLYVYHGHLYGGIHHTKNHLLKMGVNLLYGHWHDIQQFSVTHEDGEKSAWSIGCLKSFEHDSGNEWLGRRPTNWGHGFAIVDFYDKSLFTVHVVRIIGGKCSLWGEIIDGSS